ncbi:hypothetical protein KC360_g8361 [Hortaea werneckii]|nr:hypothetical protein KC361_g7296 [Hortaea werneckii]KAI6879122.1 hypothetical protein KC325_g8160 [Hortaea werneckii]KAI6987042.1 hypothetical protein KC359_g8463 [Hortaea werneckii]KAI7141236.1 hypothetical protein KC344_g8133 [Hortaea werneckii]KAI7167933.1 hypothetical protein KC360_g8361 [Hortaea werneckii]
MKLSIVQLLATATALACGSPLTEVDSVPEGYEIVPAKWTGEIVPGEGPVTLEGCVESLREQILEINPDYFKNQDSTSAGSALAARTIGSCGGRAISKDVRCGVPYGTVHGKDISSGLVYLSNIGGCMTLGGKQCSRVSCSYNSGIFACNDNSDTVQAPFSLVSDIGGDMFGQCANFDDGADFTAQAFTDEGWNVLMKRQSC